MGLGFLLFYKWEFEIGSEKNIDVLEKQKGLKIMYFKKYPRWYIIFINKLLVGDGYIYILWKNILRCLDVLKEVLRNELEFGSPQNFNLYIGVIESFFLNEIGCGKSTSKSHYAEI